MTGYNEPRQMDITKIKATVVYRCMFKSHKSIERKEIWVTN